MLHQFRRLVLFRTQCGGPGLTINGEEVTRLIGGLPLEELRREREKAREVARAAEPETPAPARPTGEESRGGELPGEPGLSPA